MTKPIPCKVFRKRQVMRKLENGFWARQWKKIWWNWFWMSGQKWVKIRVREPWYEGYLAEAAGIAQYWARKEFAASSEFILTEPRRAALGCELTGESYPTVPLCLKLLRAAEWCQNEIIGVTMIFHLPAETHRDGHTKRRGADMYPNTAKVLQPKNLILKCKEDSPLQHHFTSGKSPQVISGDKTFQLLQLGPLDDQIRFQIDKLQPARWKTAKYFVWHFQFQVQLNVTSRAMLRKYLWIRILSASNTSNKICLNSYINKMIMWSASACNKGENTQIFCLVLFNSLMKYFHLCF